MRLWQAHGCWTLARQKALKAFTAARQAAKRPPRRPGSYAWPELRQSVEQAFAKGAPPHRIAEEVKRRYAECPARPPSRRTIRRGHAERRWLRLEVQVS
jgi:hypothetical protein